MAMEPRLALLLMLFIACTICKPLSIGSVAEAANPIEELVKKLRGGAKLPLDRAKNWLSKEAPIAIAPIRAALERQRAIAAQTKIVEYWERIEKAAKVQGALAEYEEKQEIQRHAPPPAVQESAQKAKLWEQIENFASLMVKAANAKLKKLK